MTRLKFALAVCLLGLVFTMTAQDEKSATDLYNEGVAEMKSKNYETAFKLFSDAYTASAEDTSSTAMKVHDLAKENITKAAYYHGNNLRKAKDYEGAIAVFDKGLEMNDFYAIYPLKAAALDKLKKNEEAVAAYFLAGEKFVEAGKPVAKAVSYYRKAMAKLYKGKAWDMLIEKAEAYPDALTDVNNCYYVAKANFNKKNFEAAVELADKAMPMVKEGKDNGKYLMLKGDALAKLGKKSEAIEAYNTISSDSQYADRAKYLANELQK